MDRFLYLHAEYGGAFTCPYMQNTLQKLENQKKMFSKW